MCRIAICEMCRTVRAQSLLVFTSCKCSINPITNPNPVYCDNILYRNAMLCFILVIYGTDRLHNYVYNPINYVRNIQRRLMYNNNRNNAEAAS
jgi:hypothetical protein